MKYLGNFRPGQTIRGLWNSADANGASVTRATDGTIAVYKDSDVTQVTTGLTDSENFDGVTGIHQVVIDTSASPTFYTAGSHFQVVLAGATIDGQVVNAVLFEFDLINQYAPARFAMAVR